MRARILTVFYALVLMALLVGIFFAPILFFNGKR